MVRSLRVLVLTALLILLLPATAAAAVVPPGFTEERVMLLTDPTALAFTPDATMLVTTQSGQMVRRDSAGRTSVVLDLTARVCSNRER